MQTAQENLNLAQRQVEALKAQRMSAEAGLMQAKAQLNQAQVNLERTRIFSTVDGYVTNRQAQLGDYVNVGASTISVVDANSFWVDGYFEETNLALIRVGDPAQVKLTAIVKSSAVTSIASLAPSTFQTHSPPIRGLRW